LVVVFWKCVFGSVLCVCVCVCVCGLLLLAAPAAKAIYMKIAE
jgi:hypothetical protein